MTQTVLMTLLGVVLAVGELVIGVAVGWWLRSRQLGLGVGESGEEGQPEGLMSLATRISESRSLCAEQIREIKGKLSTLGQSVLSDNDQAVVGAMSRMIEQSEQLQTELAKIQNRVETQSASAGTDAETGLVNRKGFDVDLGRRFAQWEHDKSPISMVVIDVDNLAEIEEEHGKQASEAVIAALADVLCQVTREMDVVARYDDQEFAFILPGTDLAGARKTATQVRSAVAAESFVTKDDIELDVTISEGVVEAIEGDDVGSITKRARRALDSARQAGRDQAHSHDGTICRPILDEGESQQPSAGFVDLDLSSQSNQESAQTTDPRIDPLTGQLSRRAFSDYVREQVIEQARVAQPLALALIEIDALERIASKQGQAIADVVVRTLTQIVCTATHGRDQVARYDHGTLALVSSGIELDDATMVAERIRRAVGACKLRAGGKDLMVTVSVGVAQSATGEDSVALMSHADAALKSARIAGRNCTHCWDAESRSAAEALLAVV